MNLVIPIDDGGTTLYVHSMPISREVFERYFLPISRAFNMIYTQGLGTAAGPRVAALTLKQVSIELGLWDGDAGVQNGLMNEIKRLANVVSLTPNGWQSVPYEQAIKENMLSDDIASEVENIIVFFTVASWMHLKAELPTILKVVCGLWNARVESSNSTEFASSLPTSTKDESSGATAAVSSVPS
jgi:hypothetical protein